MKVTEQKRRWGREWDLIAAEADLYICRDKKSEEKKWMLIIDKQTGRKVLQKEIDEVRKLNPQHDKERIYWITDTDENGSFTNIGIECENPRQIGIVWDYLRGSKTIKILHKKEVIVDSNNIAHALNK